MGDVGNQSWRVFKYICELPFTFSLLTLPVILYDLHSFLMQDNLVSSKAKIESAVGNYIKSEIIPVLVQHQKVYNLKLPLHYLYKVV